MSVFFPCRTRKHRKGGAEKRCFHQMFFTSTDPGAVCQSLPQLMSLASHSVRRTRKKTITRHMCRLIPRLQRRFNYPSLRFVLTLLMNSFMRWLPSKFWKRVAFGDAYSKWKRCRYRVFRCLTIQNFICCMLIMCTWLEKFSAIAMLSRDGPLSFLIET